ncbi:MAG: hypothetical protein ABSF50_01260 [Burkholderiaceae bacterium]|jgi:hypothetical protein
MFIGRRRLLRSGLGAALAGLPGLLRALAPSDLPPDLRALQQFIAGWDELGWQWTGTDVERASAQWLARVTSEAGLDVAVERYPFDRVDVTRCAIDQGEHHALGLPLFDGGATQQDGVSGRFTPAGEEGEIAVLEIAPWDALNETLKRTRSEDRYRAVIVITRGTTPGLAPLDCASPVASRPQAKPVVQVSSEHRDWLMKAAAERLEGTIVALFQRAPGEGRNVVSVWSGSDPHLPPIIVLCGRSGWGPCVGERVGGLVCQVYAAGALGKSAAPRTVIFAATSGSELGNMGLDAFMKRYPALPSEALGWIELGPNLGARSSVMKLGGQNAGWLQLFQTRLDIEKARWTRSDETESASSLPSAGTGAPASVAGANIPERALSLEAPATFAYHLPSDLLPGAVDLSQMLALAKAFASTILELAQA